MKLPGTSLVFFFFFLSVSINAEQLNETSVGYALQLPSGWIVERVSPQQHIFYDTTGTYYSELAILRSDFSSAVSYSTAEEWTRANFIAYQLSIEADLSCVLSYYDTMTVYQNGTIRAAEAYTYYYDPDTAVGDWAEYIRFAAIKTRGYELYALGPVADMDSNINVYAQILQSIVLLDSADAQNGIRTPYRQPLAVANSRQRPVQFHDLLGRPVSKIRSVSPQVFLKPGRTVLTLRR